MVTGLGTLRASDLAQDLAGTAGAPKLSSVSPATGSTAGGTAVTLTGCGFVSGSTVMIDGATPATNVQLVNSTTLTAAMPAHGAGGATITVVNPGPLTSNSKPFTYAVPTAPPLAGGTGTDNGLWVFSGSSGYVPKGGQLLGAPAIVGVPRTNLPADPLYLGTGLDHNVWVRSDSQGWQPLASAGAYCIDNPAAAVVGSTLYVACEGGDHALWYNSGSVVSGSLPVLGGWAPLGGVLAAGPAVAGVNGLVTFMVLGTDHQVWIRTLSSGYSAFGARCNGHPALATTSNGTTSYFACDGTDGTLWYGSNTGGVWSGLSSPGGHLVDGPGIAALPSPSFFVEGTDGSIWEWSAAGWVPHGGRIVGGVGATGLS
jgi:hypothetical protein